MNLINFNSTGKIAIIVALAIIVLIGFTVLSIQRPAGTSIPIGHEKLLKVNGVEAVLFDGAGCGCQANFEPVCGSDQRSYFNQCFAQCASVTATAGPCGGTPVADSCRPTGTSSEGEPCGQITPEHELDCQAGLVCIDGHCTRPTDNLPGQGQPCGAAQYDPATGTGYYNPATCSTGLTCQNGLCYPPASCYTPVTPTTPPTTDDQNSPCLESDGGDVPDFASSITGPATNGQAIVDYDTCTSGNNYDTGLHTMVPWYRLKEWYCSNGIAMSKTYACTSCNAGVCQGATPS